uniref:osteoclast-associated immunoglobulin-like receptor n=1 Tax=Pristiophorus japonicus TaxID=55135 RepID=UPI00398F4CB8
MVTFSVILGIVHLVSLVGYEIVYNIPKPTLSLDPPYAAFLNSERVILTCRCQCSVTKHRYYRGHDLLLELERPEGKCETKVNLPVSLSSEGTYACQCFREGFVPVTASPASEPVTIHITDTLLKPTISTAPASGAVSNGQKVDITCKGDIRLPGVLFFFYKGYEGRNVQTRAVLDTEWSDTFTINSLNKSSAGKYCCRYQSAVPGHRMDSPLSKYVTITVKEQYLTDAIVRLCLCALVIIVMLIIIVEHFVTAMSLDGRHALDNTDYPSFRYRQNRVEMSLD